MTALGRVGVLHAPFGAASLTDIRRAARDLCEPVLLIPHNVAQEHPDLCGLARRMFPVVVAAAENLPLAVAEQDLIGLTTFHDSYVDVCDDIAGTLRLPGPAGTPWDKLTQRTTLHTAGLTGARAVPVDSASDFAAGVTGFDACVLKPRRGAGGRGVSFVASQDDVEYQLANRTSWSGLMIETALGPGRHLSGAGWLADFVSVETVTDAAGSHHLAIFDKTPVQIVKHAGADGADAVFVTGDITPTRLSDNDQRQLVSYVHRCLTALGVRARVTHTEVKLTSYGYDIIEINGRVGGHLSRLLRMVNGPDLVRAALAAAAGGAMAQPANFGSAVPANGGYAMGMFPPFPPGDGLVRSDVSAADIRGLPGVVGVDDVARHGSPRRLSDNRLANLTLRAPTARDLDRVADEVAVGLRRLFAADFA